MAFSPDHFAEAALTATLIDLFLNARPAMARIAAVETRGLRRPPIAQSTTLPQLGRAM